MSIVVGVGIPHALLERADALLERAGSYEPKPLAAAAKQNLYLYRQRV